MSIYNNFSLVRTNINLFFEHFVYAWTTRIRTDICPSKKSYVELLS